MKAPIPTDVRQLIIKQLGKALAARWRAEHREVDGDRDVDRQREEGADRGRVNVHGQQV
jgi:hypothetical protein